MINRYGDFAVVPYGMSHKDQCRIAADGIERIRRAMEGQVVRIEINYAVGSSTKLSWEVSVDDGR